MPIYQFNSEKERVTSHETILEAQEMTGISAKKILSSMNKKKICEEGWYFSRQPFIDILPGYTRGWSWNKSEQEVDKGKKVVKCNFSISVEFNERINNVIDRDEERGLFFRKAVLEYVEKIEAEKSELQ